MIKKIVLAFAALLLSDIAATAPGAYAANTISACGAAVSTAGTYTVTTDLTTASTTPCITITASGVAIDLQGHMIIGTGSASTSGAGIIDNGSFCSPCQQNIIVANGTIQGFLYGIYLTSTEYATIANMNVVKNTGIGIAVFQAYAAVTDSQATYNGLGIFLRDNATVSNSQANNNGNGMEFGNSTSLSSSQANNNGDLGMAFGGNATVNKSQANNNPGAGMFFGSGDNTISDSEANNNNVKNGFGQGIGIVGSGNSVTGNTANGNYFGISLYCPSNLYGNTATRNPGGNLLTINVGCALLGNNFPP
jgi:hypothetical protein